MYSNNNDIIKIGLDMDETLFSLICSFCNLHLHLLHHFSLLDEFLSSIEFREYILLVSNENLSDSVMLLNKLRQEFHPNIKICLNSANHSVLLPSF